MRRSSILVLFAGCLFAVIAWLGFGTAAEGPVGGIHDGQEVVVDGPSASQESTAIDRPEADPATERTPASLPDALEVLAGRLLDPDGEPFVRATPAFRLRGPQGDVRTGDLETDDDGAFTLPVEVAIRAMPGTLEIQHVAVGGRPLGLRVALPAPAPGERTDLGDLKLAGIPKIASGRVVDDAGMPIADAVVVLQVQGPPVSSKRRPQVFLSGVPLVGGNVEVRILPFDGDLDVVQAELEQLSVVRDMLTKRAQAAIERATVDRANAEKNIQDALAQLDLAQTRQVERLHRMRHVAHFADHPLLRTTTGRDGKFVLYSLPLDQPFRLRAEAEQHRPEVSVELANGASAELQLRRTANLAMTVLLPEWMPPTALAFTLVRGEDSSHIEPSASDWGREDRMADIRFDDLEPGQWNLVVRVRNLPTPLASVDQILIEPGRTNTDPRLKPLDLLRSVFRYELTAVDDAGRQMKDIPSPLLARIQQQDGKFRYVGFPWKKNKAEVFSASPTMQVTLLCAGYRLREVTLHHGRRSVVFQRIHPVELVFPGLRDVCGEGRKVRVSVVGTSSTGLPSAMTAIEQRSGAARGYSRWHLAYSGGAWLGTTDTVHVPLVRNGEYSVILRLHEEGVGGDVSITVKTIQVILDGSMAQRYVIPFDRKPIADGIASLEQRKQ